ncbi:DUF126 domain-containing protein [Phyllobacterium sp. 0TCS1.6C]|uniref:aconitase X swivel domain-containing protein n=1 Tax=unclassified Phyllobacterium TaxID=2638441 RepID=UPI0022644B6B|nr:MULTISPECIES: DUF126 domain-containing protein [unclassified Phyllobacterium]MCX8281841.1 DUF126 domain-containing protein [Phyllobacterium sp. 0TCS1.6C]MCX8295376.1 DUF126 domain-containing protein [Phyllobacterium sp. 0TCS1.6A]
MNGKILVSGTPARAPALIFTAPISFWGGINPKTAMVADVRHPQHGLSISGKVLFLPGTIGSSSAAAILLELVSMDIAPAALVLHEPDAILLLGLIVAQEMGHSTPIAIQMDRSGYADLAGRMITIAADGTLSAE